MEALLDDNSVAPMSVASSWGAGAVLDQTTDKFNTGILDELEKICVQHGGPKAYCGGTVSHTAGPFSYGYEHDCVNM
jgi:hypothetical protein